MTQKSLRGKEKNQKVAYLFLAPALIVLTVFVFVPLIGAFVISLTDIDVYMQDFSFINVGNYVRVMKDERVWNATFNTLFFTGFEVPLQIFLALVLLMFMTKNNRFHKLLRTVFYLPYVCSMTAISIMWSMLINTNYGILPYCLSKIGIDMPNLLNSVVWVMPTVIFVSVWKGFGYTLTILSAAALGIPNATYEAAEIDGASSFQKFIYVTIPGIKHTIGFCLVTTLIIALQVFDQIYVMTDGGPQYKTETLVGYIYNRGFRTAPFELGYASAVAVFLFFIIMIITFSMRKYTFGQGEEQ